MNLLNIRNLALTLIIISAGLFAVRPAVAQQPGHPQADGGLYQLLYPELREYLELAADENPELNLLRHLFEAERQKVPQVGTLPDPELNIGFDFNPMESGSALGRFSISAMQMFPWFGTLESRREMQRASADADLQRISTRQLDLFESIQTLWLDLSEMNLQIGITEETIQLIRDLELLVETRYETGRTSQADLLRIQMEEQRLKTTIENLIDRKNPVRARFNALLNRDLDAGVETAEKIDPFQLQRSEEELKTRIREFNPRFDEIASRDRMLRSQRDLARLEGRPSFGVGVEVMGRDFGVMSMNPDMTESFIGMASIRIPIYRSRYRAQYRQATEQLRSLDSQLHETENRLMTELEEAFESYRESKRSLLLLDEELIPRASQALEILMEDYSAGRARFDELLQIQRELLDLEYERIEVLVRQNKAVLALQRLVGFQLAEGSPHQ